MNTYVSSKYLGIRSIDKEENYTKHTIGISRAQLLEMFEEGDIIGIKR